VTDTPAVGLSRKEELELERLHLEVAALRQRWWTKPAYIAALVPTLIAIGSLSVAWKTGYFQAATIKLENQKHDLEGEIRAFTATRDQLVHDNQRLNVDRKQLADVNARLQQERGGLQNKLTQLAATTNQMEQRQQRLTERIQTLQHDVHVAPVRLFLDSLRLATAYPGNEQAVALLKALNDDSLLRAQARSELETAFQTTQTNDDRACIAYVLFFATREQKWRDILFGIVRDSGAHSAIVLEALSDHAPWIALDERWRLEDKIEIVKVIASLLNKPDIGTRSLLLRWASRLDTNPVGNIRPAAPIDYGRIVLNAREAVVSDFDRDVTAPAFSLLHEWAPTAYLVLASDAMLDEEKPMHIRADLANNTRLLPSVRGGYVDLDQPVTPDLSAWKQWREKHQKLVAAWHDLKTTQISSAWPHS